MPQKKLNFKGRCAVDTEYGVYEHTPGKWAYYIVIAGRNISDGGFMSYEEAESVLNDLLRRYNIGPLPVSPVE